MIVARTFIDMEWVDVSSPTKEDIDSLMLSYNVDPGLARDLISPTPKQQVHSYPDSFYTVIHIPVFSRDQSNTEAQEIDCVITRNSLITVRYDSIDALHYFGKQMEANQILAKNEMSNHPVFGLIKEIYKQLTNELLSIDGWLREIEKRIFEGQEKQMVLAISAAARHILSFRRIIAPHNAVWQNLHTQSKEKFGDQFAYEARLLSDEIDRLLLSVDNLAEMANELRETNNSLLSTKQNEIMKVLTIMAFVTFPLSLIATIFGMSTTHLPIIGKPGGFWIVIMMMLGATLAMFGFFRYKRWL